MDEFKGIWIFFGTLLILAGITGFITPFNIWWTKIINEFKGVKTNITPQTITMWKFIGFLFCFFGFMMIFTALTN